LCQWYIGERGEEKQRKEQERKADKKEKSMKGKRIDTGLYKGCKGNLELKMDWYPANRVSHYYTCTHVHFQLSPSRQESWEWRQIKTKKTTGQIIETESRITS
jgi:hypothetical protein